VRGAPAGRQGTGVSDSRVLVLLLLAAPRNWLQLAEQRGAQLASICTGALVLARAGLLDGRSCTTHWMFTERRQREHPRARPRRPPLRRGRRLMTSTGIASGIDLSLAQVEQEHGPLLSSRPDLRLGATGLARIAAMSRRHLNRCFRRATGITPSQFATKVRVQAARDLLDDPQLTVHGIAARCGFSSARQLSRQWRQSFGTSIARFRRTRDSNGQ
jgi:transcriptional regulator GlxA family with amidase domain